MTDIEPAPANFACATLSSQGMFHQRSANESIELADQDGHWRITHDNAMTTLNNV